MIDSILATYSGVAFLGVERKLSIENRLNCGSDGANKNPNSAGIAMFRMFLIKFKNASSLGIKYLAMFGSIRVGFNNQETLLFLLIHKYDCFYAASTIINAFALEIHRQKHFHYFYYIAN